MRRAALALGLFLTPLIGWAAYNQLPPGIITQASLGTGVWTALQNAVGAAGSFVVYGGDAGTPSADVLTNATGLPVATGLSGLGADVATALVTNAGAPGGIAPISGALTTGDCVAIGAGGTVLDAGGPCTTGGGGGTVLSGTSGQLTHYGANGTTVSGLTIGTGVATALGANVGATGGIAPISGTLTNGDCIQAGASGVLVDSGAACAVGSSVPVTGVTGLGTGVLTALQAATGGTGGIPPLGGTLTNGDCLSAGASGTIVDAGGPCTTGGGGGTVASGLSNQLAYYSSSGTTVSGFPSGTGVVTALGNAVNAINGLVQLGGTAIGTGVQTALSVAINAANGLLTLNSSGYIPSTPQVGVSTNSNAAAGNIGEVVSSIDKPIGGAALATMTAVDLTSVTLSAGDWDCSGAVLTQPGGSTTITIAMAWISPVATTAPSSGFGFHSVNESAAFGLQTTMPTGTVRITCTSTVCTDAEGRTQSALTVHLGTRITWANNGGGTMVGQGSLSCRRMR